MDFTSTESRAQNKPAIRRTLKFGIPWKVARRPLTLPPFARLQACSVRSPDRCALLAARAGVSTGLIRPTLIRTRPLRFGDWVQGKRFTWVERSSDVLQYTIPDLNQLKLKFAFANSGYFLYFLDSMDSTGVHVEDSSLPSDNCSLGSSRASKPAMAKRSHAICLHRGDNSDENVAASKRARFGATNMSKPKCIDDKSVLMGVPAEAENGDIGISSDENPELCSLDYRRCSSEDKDHSADDSWIDDIFFKESVRKKLQFLSYMVGMDCSNPVEVLSEVVRVLKELNGGWWSSSRES
ncbi:unnamed protein product [Victoria cruziana]